MSDIFAELEKRIAAKKRELEEEERALAVLKRTMARSVDNTYSNTIIPPESIRFEDLVGSVEHTKKRTLLDDVRDTVSKFGSNEFNVGHVDAALQKMGIKVDAKSPRARISLMLGKLVEEGFLTMTFKGAGNVPNRYKLKAAVDTESLV